MAVIVWLADDPAAARFGISPLAELATALHVLDDPAHHRHHRWAARTRSALPAPVAAQCERFAPLWRGFRARMLLPAAGRLDRSLAEEIDALGSGDPVRFLEAAVHALRGGGPLALATGVADSPDQQRLAAAHARALGGTAPLLLAELLADAAEVRQRLCQLLQACRPAFFDQLWAELAPTLGREARHRRQVAARLGVPAALSGAIPTGRYDPARHAFLLDKVHTGRIDLRQAPLALVPTAFGHPHLVVKDETAAPVIQYPLADPAARQRPALPTLHARLSALADPVRLQLCRDLARGPRSTLQLSERWQLPASQVSRHLRVLRDAGLVSRQQRGHFVLYRLATADLASLGEDLLASVLR